MTNTRLVFQAVHFDELKKLVFDRKDVEGAAFVLCGESKSDGVVKLMSHAVVPIAEDDYLRRDWDGLSINSRALSRITKLARYESLSILFAHSHPGGWCHFSDQDDREEEKLFPFLSARVPDRIHGSVVLTENDIVARLYCPERIPIDTILLLGTFLEPLKLKNQAQPLEAIHDRQVRAFGKDTQNFLRHLKVGVVGQGGTGSPLAEQLYRLGVGELLLIDPDKIEDTNLNRIYGAGRDDVGVFKVKVADQRFEKYKLGAIVTTVEDSISFEDCARRLSSCDIVFGCTDKQLPRAILTKLAIQYCIPVFDTGVLIDSQHGKIRSVVGRVTTLLPGEACLFCRGRITAEGLRIESLSEEDRANQVAQGYAPELLEPAPSVIAFTSTVASFAVTELLHRLSKFMGHERLSSEVLINFDETKLHRNRRPPTEACFCGSQSLFGRGDEDPFLGMMWPTRGGPNDGAIS